MCGRFTISKSEIELEKRFQANFYSKVLEARYNIAPTQQAALITGEKPDEIQLYQWGLIPFWAKTPAIGAKMINARSETIREKPAFKNSMQKRRCIVLADGWYEWKRTGKGKTAEKTPYRITLKNGEAFAMAGVWSTWNPAQKGEESDPAKTIHSFTILTQNAVSNIADIHDRMPVLLLPEQERLWIDHDINDAEIAKLMTPYPQDELAFYTVSSDVNNTRNQDISLLDKVEPPKPKPIQPDLFSDYES
jgi:putative SOS response-associated peptidase YedK